MRAPPPAMLRLLAPSAACVSRRVWSHAVVLVVGTLLAPTQSTLASALRVTGRDQQPRFHPYHRVLSRDR